MEITIKTTGKKQVLDITDTIQDLLEKAKAETGVCTVFIKHTTAALTTADLDPGTDLDMLDAFERIVPKLKYRHPHNPDHVPDHIMSSILGSSVVLPVEKGELSLGTWQRAVLVELDGPRERSVIVSFIPAV